MRQCSSKCQCGAPGKVMGLALLMLLMVYCDASESREQERGACEAGSSLNSQDARRKGSEDEMEIEVYQQEVTGTKRKELIARGLIDAPSWRVLAVIFDYDKYEEFMPYTVESRTLRKVRGAVTVFQRLNFSEVAFLISERVYIIEVSYEETEDRNYYVEWSLADDSSNLSSQEGVVPVVNDGYWELVPIEDGTRTLASYCVDTDPGGWIPAWAANFASSNALPEVIEAVRQRVKSHAYDDFAPAR
jgi:Polyketide cyclase / dehydrase and lipid transport